MTFQTQSVRFGMHQWEPNHVITAHAWICHGMNVCGVEELCQRQTPFPKTLTHIQLKLLGRSAKQVRDLPFPPPATETIVSLFLLDKIIFNSKDVMGCHGMSWGAMGCHGAVE